MVLLFGVERKLSYFKLTCELPNIMPKFENHHHHHHHYSAWDSTEDDGLSEVNLSNLSSKNKRVATRYVRDDIVVALCEITQLSFGKENFIDFVTLNDITSRGLSFSTFQYMAIRKKIVLNLKFHLSEQTFKIAATVVYRSESPPPYQYGVKFDYDNHELSDHLLETQRTLVFK